MFCKLARVLRKSISGFKQAAKEAEENQISSASLVEANLEERDERKSSIFPPDNSPVVVEVPLDRTVKSDGVSDQLEQSSEPTKLSRADALRKMARARTRVNFKR